MAVPSLSSNVFEQDVLHVAVAETAQQTGHNRPLRNSTALTIRPETQRTNILLHKGAN